MLWLTGCVSTVDGRHRAGVPFINDTVEGRYERSVLECWAAVKDVLAFNGQVTSEDHQRSTLQASINQRNVWVKVEPLDQRVTRVIIQTRISGGTDRQLAAELKSQVAIRLATGNLTPASGVAPAK